MYFVIISNFHLICRVNLIVVCDCLLILCSYNDRYSDVRRHGVGGIF